MINNTFQWETEWWSTVQSGMGRRPSALLLVGPKGIGKTEFALRIARSWLCQSPLKSGDACGQCPSCTWMSQAQHPDFRWVRPDAEAAEEGGAAEGSEEGGTEGSSSDAKKKSQEIRIEQIRSLAGFANIGSHRGGLRVVLISPANRMNYAAANALLKTLEEPAPSLAFILVADQLHAIPATILSRCRRINLSVPDAALAKAHSDQSQSAPWLIPLLASDDIDPIRWAEKAGKSPPADTLDLLMRWMADAARVRLGLAPRAFPEQAAALRRQALRIRSDQSWAQTMAELQRLRAVAEHPLNPKLFYESIFDRLRRVLI
jgi:DNA polymerase-3 subunit delta'